MPKTKIRRLFSTFLILIGMSLCVYAPNASSLTDQVFVIELNDDTINPVTAEYITHAINKAELERAQCLIIKLDTPGGLLSSTRSIVKRMLTADVPLVVYIAPNGSRAGSAGVFITYASHIAAMAPSSNIGAAHPVQMGNSKPKRSGDWQELRKLIDDLKGTSSKEESINQSADEESQQKDISPDENPMSSKVLNDTLAFIRSIAKTRNRNVDWAIESVSKSASITSDEALEKNVVELIAENEKDLLAQLNGREVVINDQTRILETENVTITRVEMDVRQQFFNILANPNIAYFLMILGFYGLMYEITHPGFGVPGVLGTIFLILALYSMQTLPTNYAGLALMVLGLCLLIAEAYAPGFGLLALGGLTCLVLGSMLLFESVDPVMQVSKIVIITFSTLTGLITIFLVKAVLSTMRSKVHSGRQGLIGETGQARAKFNNGKGKVFVHGEIWNAISDETIKKDDDITVSAIDGLTLKVKKFIQGE